MTQSTSELNMMRRRMTRHHSLWNRKKRQHVGVTAYAACLTIFALLSGFDHAIAETRKISFYNMHTKERLTVTYKRDGVYDDEALTKINHILRDWRRNEMTRMSPKLIDLAYDVHAAAGSRHPIHIVSGYRSPVTNASLRKRSSGVAKRSRHMLGQAMDMYIPDISLEKMHVIALRFQRGGVGYYPKSGRPFIHLDVGNVRHWPRMTRQQLARVFPDGHTLHVPSDNRPLKPGTRKTLLATAGGQREIAKIKNVAIKNVDIQNMGFSFPKIAVLPPEIPVEGISMASGTISGNTLQTKQRPQFQLFVALPPARPPMPGADKVFPFFPVHVTTQQRSITPVPIPSAHPHRLKTLANLTEETPTVIESASTSKAMIEKNGRNPSTMAHGRWQNELDYQTPRLGNILLTHKEISEISFAILSAPDQKYLIRQVHMMAPPHLHDMKIIAEQAAQGQRSSPRSSPGYGKIFGT